MWPYSYSVLLNVSAKITTTANFRCSHTNLFQLKRTLFAQLVQVVWAGLKALNRDLDAL